MPDNDQNRQYLLPLSLAQPLDIGRVLREIGLIDEHLRQAAIKDPDKKIDVKASTKLNDLLEANDIDINNASQRDRLVAWLEQLKQTAKIINISFGDDASEAFTQKIVEWFRKEIDSQCLIIVGLEPSIGIGSIVRTSNRVFDLSLKNRLKSSRSVLVKGIHQVVIQENQ